MSDPFVRVHHDGIEGDALVSEQALPHQEAKGWEPIDEQPVAPVDTDTGEVPDGAVTSDPDPVQPPASDVPTADQINDTSTPAPAEATTPTPDAAPAETTQEP